MSGPGPSAERRLVSVLFVDLVGFTTLAEGRDAEDTRELLTRYFDLAREVVGRYGGVIEKFIGDAVMAVWGTPLAHEDDAERAVRAGLELVDAVEGLGGGITARAGVLTGEAAVSIGAIGQGMVAGDLVNTAARLQSVAPSRAVVVGESTMQASSNAIVFEPIGEQSLKGKASPVAAFRAVRVVAERGGRNRSDTLEPPFVGRVDELRLLKELFHATSREQRTRLVSVIGPAGIGKSRLAWEFLKYLDGLVETVRWHQGRSPAYGEGITFWALGEMVRGRCGLLETDDERATRAKLADALDRFVPDPDERRWLEPALLTLLGLGEGSIAREQLFAAWRTFFERLAATGTVVMVFEDLHWADAGTLDFIDHLLEWAKSAPIYILTLARPELLEKRPEWEARRRSFLSLYLDPLSEAQVGELLAGLVPGLPESAVRSIVARADGVPLYAVETVRMLLAEGRLAKRPDGAYVPAGDLSTLAVPVSLTALIAARLDGLDPVERDLVCDGAVLGQSFTRQALAAVAGNDETELDQHLGALVRREILALEADPRSPERGQYAFVQALIREVAYNTLARNERKTRHLAAARYFESLGSDELAGALAGHYLAAHAHAQSDPERLALAAQARIALRAAAERAASLGSHDQAVAFLQQALTVTSDHAEEAELLERAGESASVVARYDDAEAFLRRALELRRSGGDRSTVAHAAAGLGRTLLTAARTEAALAVLEPAAADAGDPGADPAVVDLLGELARAYFKMEEPRRAIEVADRALDAAERLDLVGVVAEVLVTKGSTLAALGRGYEGLGALKVALELAQDRDLPITAMRARNNLGAMLAQRDPAAALATLRGGLAEARRLGLRTWILALVGNAAEAALWTGEWDWALSELDELLATDLERPDRVYLGAAAIALRACRGEPVDEPLAELEALAGAERGLLPSTSVARAEAALAGARLDEARAHARAAAEASAEYAPLMAALAGRAALWQHDPSAAATHLAALEATGAHGPAIELRGTVMRAGLAALDGRPGEAMALYRAALRGWRELGLPFEEALTGIDMITVLDPSDPEVRDAASNAKEILARLGARPFLERFPSAPAATPEMVTAEEETPSRSGRH